MLSQLSHRTIKYNYKYFHCTVYTYSPQEKIPSLLSDRSELKQQFTCTLLKVYHDADAFVVQIHVAVSPVFRP